jgi:hypothetical protein
MVDFETSVARFNSHLSVCPEHASFHGLCDGSVSPVSILAYWITSLEGLPFCELVLRCLISGGFQDVSNNTDCAHIYRHVISVFRSLDGRQ